MTKHIHAPRLLLVWVLLIGAVVCALPFSVSAANTQQVVQLRAADGRSVPALVTYPEGGPDTQAPVAIIHHGGPGGHPLRALSAARWAADYFAERGYITISVLSRISRDVIDQPFGAGAADIQGAVDWASQLSSGPIVLIGHSSGSVSSTLYMATTNDPRVKAIVHFAPTAWGSSWMRISMGEDRYNAVVARMRELVAQGQGDQPVYEDHHLAPPANPAWTYGYLMNARTWLSWWGPESRNRNIALFPKIRVPMLMISGDGDIFVSKDYQEELRKAASASPRVDSIMLEGGVLHEFTGAEIKASGLAFDWLGDIGIRALPRVATRVVDLKIGGEIRPGVIYEPAAKAARKSTAVMLMPDFAEDILLSPLDAIGPRLARAGYTVLIPQDRGGGWAFYRAVASDVAADQRAWFHYLAKQVPSQGTTQLAVIAHGWGGVMTPALLNASPTVAGVALIQPPPAPTQFALNVLGSAEYAKAVAQAEDAVKRGDGGKTMIIAKYRDPAVREWITHMATGFLSFWGPSAPSAPVPALRAATKSVLLIDAGKGRWLPRKLQTSMAKDHGVTSLWYEQASSPFEQTDRLATDLINWLDALPPASPTSK